MVNQSKVKDPRFWEKWRESGAVGNMGTAYLDGDKTIEIYGRMLEAHNANNPDLATELLDKYTHLGLREVIIDQTTSRFLTREQRERTADYVNGIDTLLYGILND